MRERTARISFKPIALLALAGGMLLSATALAQGVYGVASGLVLEAYPNTIVPNTVGCTVMACCGGMNLTASAGTYWLNGVVQDLTPAQVTAGLTTWNTGGTVHGDGKTACAGSFLDQGAIAANTAYYCYETPTQVPICSLTIPYPNGQPSAPIGAFQQNAAVFIGSFLANASKTFIPMHRIGEQVLFRRTQGHSLSVTTTGFAPPLTFEGGVASCFWTGNANGVCTGGVNTFAPFYPATASAGLFDVHVASYNPPSVPALVQFLDPTPYLANLQSVQAQIAVAGAPAAGSPELQTVRLTLNANALAPPYSLGYQVQGFPEALGSVLPPKVTVGNNGGGGPQNIATVAVLRGYIEPVQRLFSR